METGDSCPRTIYLIMCSAFSLVLPFWYPIRNLVSAVGDPPAEVHRPATDIFGLVVADCANRKARLRAPSSRLIVA